jgi:hypothetical protein
MVLMGVFFDRMVRLYEQENERQAVGAETGVED